MDVIAAAATPWGRSALAILRVTGPRLRAVIDPVIRPRAATGWRVGRSQRVELVAGGEVVDDGVAVLRLGPDTATGEDLCEITTHGNPVIVQLVLDALVDRGARVAQPGEFTRRAVLHGKLDLLAAESVDLVIRATTPGGLRVGRAGLSGALRARLDPIRSTLLDAIAELEARMDHPDDELALESEAAVQAMLRDAAAACRELAATQRAGRAVVDGLRIAVVGPVNVGKSTLFNQLVGHARALVHETPGTTRDIVEATCMLGPLSVTLLDTAGERAADDPIEAAGIALAHALVETADLLLVVLRAGPSGLADIERGILERTGEVPRVVVYNGVDRADAGAPPEGAVPVSALTGSGLDALRQEILRSAGVADRPDLLVATARQRNALLEVAAAVDEALVAWPVAGVAVAADAMTHGLEHLDQLTGADTREDILDAVFARFCIGK